MSLFLGIDTSNYTTSVAFYDTQTEKVIQKKQLLPVKPGEKGIRQSDAVFHHVQQIRALLPELVSGRTVDAVAASVMPRRAEGSYMPCFTVGQTVGSAIAAACGVPFYEVSHQEGHIAAALYGAGRTDLLGRDFLAFHVSGGTTESLFVTRGEVCPVKATLCGTSTDLKAGQAVDRVGLMLGLDFPCGPELEKLALVSGREARDFPGLTASMSGPSCSLSGVENKCRKMLDEGSSKEDVALYCLLLIEKALEGMIKALPGDDRPILFAGGVMSNTILQNNLKEFCHRRNREALFSPPDYSSDNAAGVAILASHMGDFK